MNLDFNIESKKLELIQWLTSLNDVSMIDKILELKNKESKDWWNEISDEEKENTSYNKLLALLDNGEKVFIADKEVVSYSIANHDEMSNIDNYVDVITFKF